MSAIWGQLAPPIPNDTSFYFRFVEDLSGLRDEAGRPLHEVDFRDELSGDEVKHCPYHGSRNGHLMNQSALRFVAKDWQEIRAGLRFLATEIPLPGAVAHGARRTWATSLLPMFVPLYLVRKSAAGGLCTTLPTEISGLFKVMLDVPTTIDLMLIRDSTTGARPLDRPYAAGDVATFAEESGVLNNGDWTCAAPPGLIDELLQIVVVERAAEAHDCALARMVDPSEYAGFFNAAIGQYALTQAFQLSTSFVMERACQESPTLRERRPAAEPLSAYETRRRFALGACVDASSTQRAIGVYTSAAASGDQPARDARMHLCDEIGDVVSHAGGLELPELLSRQLHIQALLGEALSGLRRAADDALGLDPTTSPPIDLTRLSHPDFPTSVLREMASTL